MNGVFVPNLGGEEESRILDTDGFSLLESGRRIVSSVGKTVLTPKKTIITDPEFAYLGDQVEMDNFALRGSYDGLRHADKTSKIFINEVKEKIEEKYVYAIMDFSDIDKFLEKFFMIRGLLDYAPNQLNLVMPYYLFGQSERVDKKGDVATAGYGAEILSLLPAGLRAKTVIHIFDIHALVEKALFGSNVHVELHTFMNVFYNYIRGKYVVFPDEGAFKRFKEFLRGDVIMEKRRGKGDERYVSIKEGNPEGQWCVVVDDAIQGGGTSEKAAKELKAKGARKVSVFVPHGVFPKNNQQELAKSPYIDELIVADTIPKNRAAAQGIENMHCVGIRQKVNSIVRGNVST